MIRITALSSFFILSAAGLGAAQEPVPCGETDFECIQSRETEKFGAQIEAQKKVWLERWTDAKKRGETMMKEHGLSCGELAGMERMKCRVEAAKKLKEWKEAHEAKKDSYLERFESLKADFAKRQKEEDSLWSQLQGDFSEKAKGIKEQLLGGDTIESFLGPSKTGESLESRVNAALERGRNGAAGAAANAGRQVAQQAAHYEKLQKDRDACRNSAQVSSCLEQVGVDHEAWKREFEARKKQAEAAAAGLKLP